LYNEFVLAEVVDEDPNDYPDGEIFRKGTIRVAGKTMEKVHEGLYPESKIIEYMNQALSLLNDEDIDVIIQHWYRVPLSRHGFKSVRFCR
jgi:hypothetical protein